MNDRFLKIIRAVLGEDKMTLCLPTRGTAKYISIIDCILFLIKVANSEPKVRLPLLQRRF